MFFYNSKLSIMAKICNRYSIMVGSIVLSSSIFALDVSGTTIDLSFMSSSIQSVLSGSTGQEYIKLKADHVAKTVRSDGYQTIFPELHLGDNKLTNFFDQREGMFIQATVAPVFFNYIPRPSNIIGANVENQTIAAEGISAQEGVNAYYCNEFKKAKEKNKKTNGDKDAAEGSVKRQRNNDKALQRDSKQTDNNSEMPTEELGQHQTPHHKDPDDRVDGMDQYVSHESISDHSEISETGNSIESTAEDSPIIRVINNIISMARPHGFMRFDMRGEDGSETGNQGSFVVGAILQNTNDAYNASANASAGSTGIGSLGFVIIEVERDDQAVESMDSNVNNSIIVIPASNLTIYDLLMRMSLNMRVMQSNLFSLLSTLLNHPMINSDDLSFDNTLLNDAYNHDIESPAGRVQRNFYAISVVAEFIDNNNLIPEMFGAIMRPVLDHLFSVWRSQDSRLEDATNAITIIGMITENSVQTQRMFLEERARLVEEEIESQDTVYARFVLSDGLGSRSLQVFEQQLSVISYSADYIDYVQSNNISSVNQDELLDYDSRVRINLHVVYNIVSAHYYAANILAYDELISDDKILNILKELNGAINSLSNNLQELTNIKDIALPVIMIQINVSENSMSHAIMEVMSLIGQIISDEFKLPKLYSMAYNRMFKDLSNTSKSNPKPD